MHDIFHTVGKELQEKERVGEKTYKNMIRGNETPLISFPLPITGKYFLFTYRCRSTAFSGKKE